MRVFYISSIILLLLFFSYSCGRPVKNREKPQQECLYLIICNPGGVRAHIIRIGSNHDMTYNIGSFNDKETSICLSVTYNPNYEERTIVLSDADVKMLKRLISNRDCLYYDDSTIIKDSREYHLFINDERVLFGMEQNLDIYPEKVKELIRFILDKAEQLYDLPGMS